MKSTIAKAATLLLMLFLSVFVFAQGEKGSISGTVSDSSNAVIHGATVTVTAPATGAVRTTNTNDTGFYTVTNLPPGSYEVKVAAQGFADLVKKFNVSPGLSGTLDFTVALKGTQEVVEVTSQTQTQVDTETSTISDTVNNKRVSELPTLTRDPYDFVQTMGNVNQDSASGTGGKDEIARGAGVSINGQRSSSVDILLDGGENVDLFTTKVGQSVPLDAVQEFSVTSSNYTAEYGRASGGIVNVATKTGTNQFHGSAYEFNRLSALTSNDYESNANGVPKGKYTRNQFGYSFGGPILKNKLFFFSSTEWTRVRSNADVRVLIPDDQFLAASAAPTQGFFQAFGAKRPGLRVDQRLNLNDLGLTADPTQTPALFAYGATNPIMDAVDYFVPSDAGGGPPQNNYSTIWRVDYQLSDKTTMFGRYALFNQNEFAGFFNNNAYAGYDTGQSNFNNNAMFSITHIWSPNLISESKLLFNRLNNQQPLGDAPVSPTLFMNSNFAVSLNGLLVSFPGYVSTAPGGSIPFGGPQNVTEYAQSLSWNHGNHQFRFGGEYVYTRDNRVFGAYETAVEGLDSANGNAGALDNFLAGNVGTFQVVIDPQGKFPCVRDANGNVIQTAACTVDLPVNQPSFSRSNRFNDLAFYGQDTWKVRPRLTLNLGLRWEYYGVQHNKDDRLDSNFVLGSGNSLQEQLRTGQVFTVGATPGSPASPVGGLYKPQYHNFGPRVGFAWDVFGNGKTSLRGGYGIGYERNFGNITFNMIQNPPGQFNALINPGGAITTSNLGPFAGTGTIALPPASLRYVRQDIPTSYTENWSLSLQHQVIQNTLVSLDYSGAHAVHQYSLENLNQNGFGNLYLGTDPTVNNPLDRLNRQYGNLNTREANGFSHYNALNVRVVSTNLFHQGLDILTNYTWSHTIDNLSSTFSETPQVFNLGLLDPFNPGLDKGDADFDARHRVAISFVWELPYAHNTKGVMRQVLDGWQLAPIITARTGNPMSVFDSDGFSPGDTVLQRYIPSGAIQTTGHTDTADLGGNTFAYLHLVDPNTYFNPLLESVGVFDGDLPSCDTTTNAAGNLVSTGQNCQFPANMTRRNSFREPGVYNINLSIGKSFPITERFKLQFRSEFYNLLNHSNYYVQNGSADAANFAPGAGFDIFGKRGVNPAPGIPNERRFIQLALRLTF